MRRPSRLRLCAILAAAAAGAAAAASPSLPEALAGVYKTHQEGRDLVYREPSANKVGDRACVLHLGRRGAEVVLSDEDGSCQAYCGARGSFSDDSFPASSRRPIRYMARLKASSQYRDALKEDQARAFGR